MEQTMSKGRSGDQVARTAWLRRAQGIFSLAYHSMEMGPAAPAGLVFTRHLQQSLEGLRVIVRSYPSRTIFL